MIISFKSFKFLGLLNPVLYLSYITSTNQFSSQLTVNFVLTENNHTFFIVIATSDYFLWRKQNSHICKEFCSMCWMGMIFLSQIFRSFCAVYLRSLRNTMLSALNCLHNTTTLHLWYFAHVSCVKLFIALIFETQQHKMLLLIEKQLGVSLGKAASTNWTLIPGLKLMKRHKLLKGITSLSNQSHKKKTTL